MQVQVKEELKNEVCLNQKNKILRKSRNLRTQRPTVRLVGEELNAHLHTTHTHTHAPTNTHKHAHIETYTDKMHTCNKREIERERERQSHTLIH